MSGRGIAAMSLPSISSYVRLEASNYDGVETPEMIGPSVYLLSLLNELYSSIEGPSLTPQGRLGITAKYAAVDFSKKILEDGVLYSVGEYLIVVTGGHVTQTDLDAIPRITEEEFYAI